MTPDPSDLLHWYDTHRRTLPWRSLPGQHPDPYAVWLSEIMLQQTTVKAVIPYFNRFMRHYPSVHDMAQVPLEDILRLWAGLGYYARARNLHACARRVTELGAFPDTVEGLLTLPGVGAYTARAIASIAFGIPVVPVDGNVERVTARLFAIEAPLPQSRTLIARRAASLNDGAAAIARPSDFTQALFDLGATVCTPRAPSCLVCPWQNACQAKAKGLATALPARQPRQTKPTRYGIHFLLHDPQDQLLLRQRPPEGLLGGMDEFPGPEWRATPWDEREALTKAPIIANWSRRGVVKHVFTHFTLFITVYESRLPYGHNGGIDPIYGTFRPLKQAALPGVMQKCLSLAATDPDPDLDSDPDAESL